MTTILPSPYSGAPPAFNATSYGAHPAPSLPENRVVDVLRLRGLVYERTTKTHDRLQQLNLWRLLLLGGIVRFWLWEEDITAMSLSMGWESAAASRGPQAL
jgi:hypothetical protein